ncbi:hypothetical protein ACFOOP_11025 [Marinicaulis aureus]|jgi:hypothetical protein|uniref:Uncharacterized protein n=1 Tax=Hyphococcus aureus TaxID=2666033 RepID=A0ABW1L239_9PROT|nr:hypothetical protein [Marinicaulis flavus]
MARSLNEVMKSLPKARRAKIEARATELIAEEASLQDLRKAFGDPTPLNAAGLR